MRTETEAPVEEPLSFRKVSRRYGALTALAGIDLTPRAGELTAVVGPSGCGKSTLLELRELTALADELGELTGGASTVVLKPARLSALRDAVGGFVESREQAEWIREEDRQPLALLREMLFPLEQLSGEATRAALSPAAHRSHS